MILESIVTTVDGNGRVNIAPMGPTVQGNGPGDLIAEITLRPFGSSTTYANLKPGNHQNSGKAVVHVTDDAMLFARGAAGDIAPEQAAKLVTSIDHHGYRRLIDCHRWFAVEADHFSEDDLRATVICRIIDSGVVRPFFGFNRAKHAVIEAAILATRTHLIAAEKIDQELERLRPLVDKTCGPQEREAFDFLVRTIEKRCSRERTSGHG
ncbi:hypothetical protein LF1_22050 [Rubripirellula obstinata]|uniref:DUF447 family protein n=1 Tax=Rubripirellula obstinata TaxID=406547 RepID=A0A5B1CJH1_9BACT|nr:DUF447 domain-containing protein [Rubripirellula obstinata]KAA1259670.1 hypothetical protein LF1_22050 [Rubripirellula obstinata]